MEHECEQYQYAASHDIRSEKASQGHTTEEAHACGQHCLKTRYRAAYDGTLSELVRSTVHGNIHQIVVDAITVTERN